MMLTKILVEDDIIIQPNKIVTRGNDFFIFNYFFNGVILIFFLRFI